MPNTVSLCLTLVFHRAFLRRHFFPLLDPNTYVHKCVCTIKGWLRVRYCALCRLPVENMGQDGHLCRLANWNGRFGRIMRIVRITKVSSFSLMPRNGTNSGILTLKIIVNGLHLCRVTSSATTRATKMRHEIGSRQFKIDLSPACDAHTHTNGEIYEIAIFRGMVEPHKSIVPANYNCMGPRAIF